MQLDITLDLTLKTPNNPLTIYRALTDAEKSVAEYFDLVDYDVQVNRAGGE